MSKAAFHKSITEVIRENDNFPWAVRQSRDYLASAVHSQMLLYDCHGQIRLHSRVAQPHQGKIKYLLYIFFHLFFVKIYLLKIGQSIWELYRAQHWAHYTHTTYNSQIFINVSPYETCIIVFCHPIHLQGLNSKITLLHSTFIFLSVISRVYSLEAA